MDSEVDREVRRGPPRPRPACNNNGTNLQSARCNKYTGTATGFGWSTPLSAVAEKHRVDILLIKEALMLVGPDRGLEFELGGIRVA